MLGGKGEKNSTITIENLEEVPKLLYGGRVVSCVTGGVTLNVVDTEERLWWMEPDVTEQKGLAQNYRLFDLLDE